ncbi:MAG: hypothetical protein IT428_28330 [Planctomycetaceae bacterium]|nr:hypothetical protein [Planctomycetaceae bacterium]
MKICCLVVLSALVCVAGGCARELGPKTSEVTPKPVPAAPSSPPETAGVDSPVPPELPETYARQEVTARKVIDESREAFQAASEFAAQSKDEFVAEAQQRLARMDARMAEYERRLNDRSKEFSAETRETWRTRLADLKMKREEMQKKLDELRRDSGSAWKDLSAGAHRSWNEMSKAFREAAAEFDDAEARESPESESPRELKP